MLTSFFKMGIINEFMAFVLVFRLEWNELLPFLKIAEI